ncbi:hypothetical protein Nepgr_011341 [Nepenthes gracilis]|uniref:Cytochrome P450 n=1 Tax=Nepenthes gracilis TaxID=150966 RepID=A0AAD3SDW2_NEPGR|nr:hypothetical protein Nepgr_011341 [Nepenthes gracilis]
MAIILSLSLFLLAIFWILLHNYRRKQPPLPPGPLALPIVGSLPFLDPELHSYFAGLAQIYGPIFSLRLGSKLGVVITSPSLAKEVLKDNDVTFANRDVPAAARALAYGGSSDIVWNPYGPEWRMLRKVSVREMLCGATLDAVYGLRREEFRRTVRYLYSCVGSPVNIGEQMFLAQLNVITSMMWGGTVGGEDRASLGAEFRRLVAEATTLLGTPNVSDFIPGLARFDLQGVEKRMKVCARRFDEMFDALIDHRRQMDGKGELKANEEEKRDFLQILLKLKDDADAERPFTIAHVKAILMDMVVGGTETASNTVEYAMAEMLNKPEVMRKVQQELDTVIGKDNIVEEFHTLKLPYLNAVVKETLRLHAVLPLLVPHCPSQSCTVGGYTIPKGSRVFINVWAIHRDPSFWPNPSEFDPERFMNNKYDYGGNDFTYLPFGSGRRICAGKSMAERMMLFSLATLLHTFDWKLPNGENLDLSEKFGIVLKKKTPLLATPLPRLCNPVLYE